MTFAIDTAEIRLPLSASDLAYLDLPSATRLDQAHRVPVTLTAETEGKNRSWPRRRPECRRPRPS